MQLELIHVLRKGEPIQFFFEIAPLCCTQLTLTGVLLKDHSQIWWQMEGICPQRRFHAENQEDLGVFDDFSKDSCHGGRMLGGCRQTVRSRYGGKAAAAAESVMTTIRQTTCKHCIAKHQFRKCVKECSYCCYFLAYPRSLQHCSTDTAEVILASQRHLLL